MARGEIGATKELASEEGIRDHDAARLMPLALPEPDLAQQILEARPLVRQSLNSSERRRRFAEIG